MKFITKPTFVVALIIFSVSLFLSFSLILLLITQNILIDQNSVDLFNLILRASFVLIGSSLSGFVAFFIFLLNKRNDEKLKVEIENKYLLKLDTELEQNRKIIDSIDKSLSSIKSEDAADLLFDESNEFKELLLIQFTKLNVKILEDYLKEINSESYFERIDLWRKIAKVYNYLELLLDNISIKENAITVVNAIKNEIKDLKEL